MPVRLLAPRAAAALVLAIVALVPSLRADVLSGLAVARQDHVAVVQLGESRLVVVDVDDGTLLQRVTLRDTIAAFDIALSGDLVAALTVEGTLVLWNWRETTLARSEPFGQVEVAVHEHERPDEVRFAPDGERVLLAVVGGEAKVVSRTGTVLGTVRGVRSLRGHASIAWNAKGDRLAFVDAEGLAVVDARSFEPLRTESGAAFSVRPTAPIECFEFHPSEPRIATGHRDARIRVTDLSTGSEVQVLEHVDPMFGPPPKKPVTEYSSEQPSIGWLAHSRDGARLAYTTVNVVYFGCFDLARAERITLSELTGGSPGASSKIVWSPDDRRAYYGPWGGKRGLPWVSFDNGPRFGEADARGHAPEFCAAKFGVFLSDGTLRALDGVTGELGWSLDAKTLAEGKLETPP
jgi:WD40 repeat protein